VSKEKWASTSVETFPGIIFKISFPNSTRRRSSAASAWSSTLSPPCALPYATASSMSLAYSAFLEAARIREGLVVASCGLYLPMAVKSSVHHSYIACSSRANCWSRIVGNWRSGVILQAKSPSNNQQLHHLQSSHEKRTYQSH
jgi:hypothetical protein